MHMLKGPSIIAIAIIVGGLVFIAIGILLFGGVSNFSESVEDKFQVNATGSGMRGMIAKTAANALEPVINALTQITKGVITSLASFLTLIGVGLCFLGWGLHKRKYLAWVLTIILMFVAIVIDVVALGLVSGASSGVSGSDFLYALIAVLVVHLIANAFIIYYLTKKSTLPMFKTVNN